VGGGLVGGGEVGRGGRLVGLGAGGLVAVGVAVGSGVLVGVAVGRGVSVGRGVGVTVGVRASDTSWTFCAASVWLLHALRAITLW